MSAFISRCLPPLWKRGITGISLVVFHSGVALFYSEVFDKRKVTVSLHPAGSINVTATALSES